MNVVLRRDGWRRRWQDDAWARGGVRLLPTLTGHGWAIRGMVSIVFIYPFENPWRLLTECWNGERSLVQLLLGWNYGARGHVCSDTPLRVFPDETHKQLLRLMMLTIAGSPLGMEYWRGGMKNGGVWKVLHGFWICNIDGSGMKWGWFESPPRFLHMEYCWSKTKRGF